MSEPQPLTPRQKLGLPELIAMGVGGMIGGGIFSVLGIAVGIAGHAAPLAFALGSLIALLAGYSYTRLALAYRDDGASFTYFQRAYPSRPMIAGVVGWTVITGYIGTLALYAFTFGAYGADLLGSADSAVVRVVLSTGVLLFFMIINLRGVRSSGHTEDIIVYTKIALLGLFAIAGMSTVRRDHLTPVFDRGIDSVFIAGATVFVAFEGFQLITNAVREIRDPDRDVPRGIYGSIVVTSLIYLGVSFVAVGSMTPDKLLAAKEYALAVAAEPALGNAGRVLIGIAALLATSSAINATVFGASRMMAEMAGQRMMPGPLARMSPREGVPIVAVVVLTGLGITLTSLGSLDMIASFSSMTFLLVSIGVAWVNFKLASKTGAKRWLVVAGMLVMATTIALLLGHLWDKERLNFVLIGVLYVAVFAAAWIYQWWARTHTQHA